MKRKNLTVPFLLGENDVKTLDSLYTNTGTALVRQELAKHHSLIDVTRFVLFKPPHFKAAKLRERRLGQNEWEQRKFEPIGAEIRPSGQRPEIYQPRASRHPAMREARYRVESVALGRVWVWSLRAEGTR